MITLNDLIKDFNPSAEIVINNDNENGQEIIDIAWNNKYDRKPSIENTKKSKMETNKIYLYTKENYKESYIPFNDNSLTETITVKPKYINNAYLTVDTSGGWAHGNYYINTEDFPYLDSNKCLLSCKFKVKKIIKNSALVKALKIKEGHILTIDMPLVNRTRYGRCKAQYLTIYNSYNGISKEYSLNTIANMINEGLEIYRY